VVAGYDLGVEKKLNAKRPYAVAVAAAHDLNDELTVILSSVKSSIQTLEEGHPARPFLLDLQGAAQRCAWKAAGLLNYGARNGVHPVASTLESFLSH